jgi:integrase
MGADESLWPDTRNGRGIKSGTFYTNLRRYLKNAGLPAGGVHVFRHSAAKLRRDAGETVEEVSRFLDHSNLATTTTYLHGWRGRKLGEGRGGDLASRRHRRPLLCYFGAGLTAAAAFF